MVTDDPSRELWASIRTNRVRTLLSVDDALKALIDELRGKGESSNTLIVLTSDNGFLLGEHRVRSKKRLPYEAAQPGVWITGPGFPAGATSDAFATNLDLVPTMVKAGGGAILWPKLDGRTLQDVLAEPDRATFLPVHVPIETADIGRQPTGDGVRTWRYKYVKYADGTQELYDLIKDPYELNNAANNPRYRSVKAGMRVLLPKACKADQCPRAPRSRCGRRPPMVEVAGVEPASPELLVGLLRAQPMVDVGLAAGHRHPAAAILV